MTTAAPRPADDKRNEEDRVLKIGYFSLMTERWGFNDDVTQCASRESAYFLHLEREHMEVPQDLTFTVIEEHLAAEHKPKIFNIWRKVLETKDAWESNIAALKYKWEQAPESPDGTAADLVASTRISVRDDLKKAITAIISSPPEREADRLSEFEQWQTEEQGLRTSLYRADKDYLVAMRAYYEMLIEKPADGTSETPVLLLDKEHPKRWKIIFENRYLRLIDAVHQGISIAKAAHHEQPDSRLRKTRQVPYLFHIVGATGAQVLDVVPHVIEERQLPKYNFVVGTASESLHDLAEDTALTVEEIEEFFTSRTDRYDSSIDPAISSSYGLSRDTFKEKTIDLMHSTVRAALRRILRVLSKNVTMSDREKMQAVRQNIAGRHRTAEVLNLSKKDRKRFKSSNQDLTANSKTFREFAAVENGKQIYKVDSFLIRLNAMTTGKEMQITLMDKLEDRAHNVSTLASADPEFQRDMLRATVVRLIAWAVLDHDNVKYPLYNALPRLIRDTLREYKRLRDDTAINHVFEDKDALYIAKLEEWQSNTQILPLPTGVQGVVDEWENAHSTPRVA